MARQLARSDRPVGGDGSSPDDAAVWLRLVGGFAVYRAGVALPDAAVGSRKARTLLAVLAVASTRLVPVDRIVDVLWAVPPKRPAHEVAVLVSRLRATLGPQVVVGGRGGYRLGDTTRVDLHVAAELVGGAEARLASQEARHALTVARHALRLLDDTLAVGEQSAWAEAAHRLHADLLRRARHATAGAALRTGASLVAQAAAAAALSADPLDEVAWRLLMRAYDTAGEPARALAAYERLRATLAAELGIDPAPASRRLHTAILRHNAVPPYAPAR